MHTSCSSGAKTLQEGWTEPPKLSEYPHLVCIVILWILLKHLSDKGETRVVSNGPLEDLAAFEFSTVKVGN